MKARRDQRRAGRAGRGGNGRRAASIGLLALVLLAAGTGVGYSAFLALATNSGNSFGAGSVSMTDNDSGTAMLSLTDAALGATDTSCIKATYTGSLGATVHHWGDISGTLAPYLSLKVTRGTGADTFDNCSDFSADGTNYIGEGAGVVYDGKLSDYPTSHATGIVDPNDGGAGNYSATVSGISSLVNYWRLGDTATAQSSDTMTGTAGTTLQSHTGETGASWTKFMGQPDLVLSDVNRLRKGGAGQVYYHTSATPSTANYSVEADLTVKSIVADDGIGLIARQDISNPNGTFYMARYETWDGSWNIIEVTGGSADWLDYSYETLDDEQTYHVEFELNGSTLTLYVDGVEKASVVDASLSAAGRAGVAMGYTNTTSAHTNSTGIHLDNFSVTSGPTTAVDSEGTNNGTYSGAPTAGVTGALAGDSNKAVTFDGSNDYVSAARQVSDDFSIEFWFKSTQGIGTDNRWTQAAGMVDANVTGTNNDFGTSLRSDGKVNAGVGNPDTSINSTYGGYNDGDWHHLVFTRKKSTGAMKLYLDGVSAGSATGATNSLTASANINLGRLASPGNYFAGTLDEVAIYNAELSAADVASHYAAVISPETWTTSEAHAYKFQISVDNDSAALGKSAAATFSWEARNQ
jgi:Concanavalin A-like lectin/glucanases superfamily